MFGVEYTERFNKESEKLHGSSPEKCSKVNKLRDGIVEHPSNDIGRQERLKHNAKEVWSRRIDGKNGLVYIIIGDTICFEQRLANDNDRYIARERFISAGCKKEGVKLTPHLFFFFFFFFGKCVVHSSASNLSIFFEDFTGSSVCPFNYPMKSFTKRSTTVSFSVGYKLDGIGEQGECCAHVRGRY
jgi:Txe/YoeB family toxin of Txe-Axe toxin-antitoxin module